MNQLEKCLVRNIEAKWKDATPGLRVQAFRAKQKIVDLAWGNVFPFYDWASLTKIVFTNTALMLLVEDGVLNLEDSPDEWLSWWPGQRGRLLTDLLTHSAGLRWWYPFYKKIAHSGRRSAEDSLSKAIKREDRPLAAWNLFRPELVRIVRSDLNKKATFDRHGRYVADKSVYSDLDFLVLGEILQEMMQKGLNDIWLTMSEQMGLENVHFNPGNHPRYKKHLYAPTEKCPWRKKILQGEVHDDNAWALAGVAPHAGLFGGIDDLSFWGRQLRKVYRGELVRGYPRPETLHRFTKRAMPVDKGDWALGFMLPSGASHFSGIQRGKMSTPVSASCGPLFSSESFGHTGFTGTSIWYDPKQDLLITILSNRVHPTRSNELFRQLRPEIHTLIAERCQPLFRDSSRNP